MILRTTLITLVVLCFSTVYAATIKGVVYGKSGEPLVGATVLVQGMDLGAATDLDGTYLIENLKAGTYILEASYTGYKMSAQEVEVRGAAQVNVNFTLEEDVASLGEVVVTGKSESTELSQNPIQIASINVVQLQSESADIVSVLDRTSGVRVRQSGGLGSNTSIQLNGLTGRAVRLYYDGIPLELFGGSIQLNNLPVNTIERIDVYKGVMPVDVGTDALAGGINVISRQVDYDYLDASYQISSFNTHIGALNASKKIGEHLVLSASGFYNYSDNDYNIRARQRTPDFQEIEVEVPRFHSVHESSMASAALGFVDVNWADKFSYSLSYNQRYDEIQHGVRIGNRAVGEANVERDALIHTLQYQKRFFDQKFAVGYFGSYSIANEAIQDSTTNVYDWFGEVVAFNSQGKEVLALPSLREGETESQVHRLNLTYAFSNAHKIKVSSFLSDQNIVGSDPIAPTIAGVDPNTIPSFLTRSISGLSYESKWFEEKLEAILFGKYYYYTQSTADFRPTSGGDQVFEFANEGEETGYGLGLKYAFKEDFFVRASFEDAIRIPTKDEVFGNFLTIEPNFFLDPEKSRNLNIGAYYQYRFGDDQFVSLDASWFIRAQRDLIRLQAGRNENDPAQFINEDEAEATGFEFTLRAAPLKKLELSWSYTKQDVIKGGEVNATNTNGAGNPIPNIPSTFYNVSSRYRFNSPLSKKDEITVFAYYTFVDEFDLIFQNTRNEQNIIPTQRQLDFGITYELTDTGLTISAQTNNLLDAEVFDNFRVPKPGRNFSLKLRYLLRKS